MTRRKRWFAMVTLLLLVVAAVAVTTSETAFRVGVDFVARAVPGLEVSGVRGRLSQGARIDHIRWNGDSATVVVSRLAAEWRFWPALVGRLSIESLRADAVEVEVHVREQDGGRAEDRRRPTVPDDIELPVLVRIDEFVIDHVTVDRAGARLLTLDQLTGEGLRADGDGFGAVAITATGTPVSARVAGTIDPTGDWPLDVTVEFELELPAKPAVSGTLSARGALAGAMDTRVQVDGAGTATWAGEVSGLFQDPRLAGRLVVRDAPLAPWVPPSRFSEGNVSSVLRLEGWPGALGIDGSLALTHPDWPRLRGDIALRWGQRLVAIRRIVIDSDAVPGVVRGNARYDWSQTPSAGAAELSWESLQWPLLADEATWTSAHGTLTASLDADTLVTDLEAQFGPDPDGHLTLESESQLPRAGRPWRGRADLRWTDIALPGATSERGSASLQGAVDGWSGTVAASVSGAGLPALEFETSATGDSGTARATGFTGTWLGGTLDGALDLAWTDGLRGTADLRMTNIDTGLLEPDWRGRVTGRLSASVDRTDGSLRWSANLSEVDGEVRGMRFTADADLRGSGNRLESIDANAAMDEARVRVNGTAAPTLELEWALSTPNLGRLSSRAGGVLDATGTVHGDFRAPAIGFDIDGSELILGDHAIGALEASGNLDLRAGGTSALRMRADAIRIRDRPVESMTLEIDGPREALEIALGARANDADLAVALTGAWRDAAFGGTLTKAEITREGFSSWALEGPAAIGFGRDVAGIERACWNQTGTDSEACIEGDWRSGTDAKFAATLVKLPLERLSAWLPTGFSYEGMLSGNASLDWRAGEELRITGRLAATPGAWRQVVRDEPVALLTWQEAAVESEFASGTLTADLRFVLVDGGNLTAELTVPILDDSTGPADTRPLHARLIGAYSDFDLLPAFVPDVGSVSGRVRTDLTVSGTRAAPLFDGTLVIEDGTTTIPRLGLRLTGLELAIDGDRDSVGVHAQARSGEGEMAFDGEFSIRDGDVLGSGKLRGTDFTVSDIPEARVVVSPDVGLELDGHSVRVDGVVQVPFARIEPRDRAGVVPVSQDQILVDTEDEAAGDSWRIGARVRMSLGDVRFEGFGLTAEITGALTAIDEPGMPTRANGELQIRNGRYAAWGQNLDIERGRLVFAGGPITDPGLDIRASRRPEEEILVGADIRGTLREPELRLFSEPAMQQSELLSWLILGIPLAQSGGSEQALLQNTRDTAGLAGGEMVLSELGRRLGIGEVGIERGDTPDQAELVIGRYLSPRFYIAYGIGIFDPSNSVRLKYHIDRRWSIEAESGQDATSTDLLYSIER